MKASPPSPLKSELKTLKDLELYGDVDKTKYENVSSVELRQEAIKWIKYGFKQIYELEGDEKNILCVKGGIDSFKRFFNITEEDLEVQK